jgi:DNA repair exonuclease SbcCD ATPase subunit
VHLVGDRCPLCEQPIPHEELDRINAKARERDAEIAARLQEQFARQRAQDEAKSKADLDRVRKEGEDALTTLRTEALTRESAAREQGKASAEAALEAQLSEAKSAEAAAEQAGASLKAELERTRKDGAAAIEHERQEAAAKAQAARQEGKVAAETAFNERLAQAEAARAEAVQGQTDLKGELHKLRDDTEKIKAEAAAKEVAIHAEATTAAESAAQAKITAAVQAREVAEEQAQALRIAHATELGEQRESLEKAALKILQDERAGWFGEK